MVIVSWNLVPLKGQVYKTQKASILMSLILNGYNILKGLSEMKSSHKTRAQLRDL